MLLEEIKSLSENLKNLDREELETLCHIIRKYIINVVSETGGHLASSLGAVEIAVICHKLLQTPEDKLIWDVGHQAYAHKILTGRLNEFSTLRQFGGISGFPKMSESPHDAFGVGHSSTSISAALGYAVAAKQKNKQHKIVSIIGDGSISSGMPFEAMNQAAHIEGLDITVILNDNEMSISPNVGALSKYFNRLRSEPVYTKLRDDVEYMVSKIPSIGKNMISVLDRVSKGVKTVIEPGAFFTQLGWDYYGPIDGHDIVELNDTLKRVFKMPGLKIVHTVTRKGKGYVWAEKKPSSFHGVGRFDIDTGKIIKSKKKSYTNIVSDYLVQLGRENEKINVISAAMPDGTGTKDFAENFPERFFDIGISEEHAPTFAAAMASQGLIPFVSIYSTFLQRSVDQIIHDVALQKLPVIFLLDRAGIVGEDGPTHHGNFDLSFLRFIPGLIVGSPRNSEELKDMIYTAVNAGKPFAIRYPRGVAEIVEERKRKMLDFKAERLKDGKKLCVISTGYISNNVYDALKDDDYGVYDFKFIKPLDIETIQKISQKYEKIVVFEENSKIGGLGSAVAEAVSEFKKAPRVYLKGLPDEFIPHGTQAILRDNYGFSKEAVKAYIREVVNEK
ncbi:MAG: 1-deoxy-D-xylulose-5-phosphate synthase [Candidatus Muiribacteriota bacterium]